MLDFSDVTEFAARLNASPSPGIEDAWQNEWSQKVADEMRSLAPVDTGALVASIHPTSDGVEVGVSYGAYVEYGTSDTASQPFAGPAVNRLARPAAEDAGRRVLREI